MALHPIRFVFPKYTSAFDQTRAHGTAGVQHAKDAFKAPEKADKLDAAVRATNSFDHAMDSSERLPLQRVAERRPVLDVLHERPPGALGVRRLPQRPPVRRRQHEAEQHQPDGQDGGRAGSGLRRDRHRRA